DTQLFKHARGLSDSTFARYALSERAGRSASMVEIRDFSPQARRASASLDGDSPREQEKSRI
ncbi:hypothetical protein CJI55_01040, partial [Gardnerella vaginalis]